MQVLLKDDIENQPPDATTIKFDTEGDNVLHYAALPNNQISIEPVQYPDDPPIKYSFELDCFQKIACACVHNNQSVLVSAHTSAGKTVIAKYAIATALKNDSRIVYTSPIKALSNQKFNELSNEFASDVGLLTGDVTMNPNASILVMTTEILRMMLFANDKLIRELSWVIFDEVHYMKDKDRGVIWEETIILLPDSCRFVFLSATIPNAREFSEWVAKHHKQVCHVVYTEYRPVPLQYFLSPFGVERPELVKDKVFLDTNFSNACAAVKLPAQPAQTFRNVKVKTAEKTSGKISNKELRKHTCTIIVNLFKNQLYPMIIFVFSKKECESISEDLSNTSFTRDEERYTISYIYDSAMETIPLEDRDLPQIQKMRELALKGIGVHHGGLMPVVKEVVEILFDKNLIKVLFATETFSMGLNMPSKTVIFHTLKKFDGEGQRLVNPAEFIQMSGRAGRRNNDKFGCVVINYTGDPPPGDLKQLMISSAQPLDSEFRVTYSMLLNLILVGNMKPKHLMRRSFHQFQTERKIPKLKSQLEDMTKQMKSIESTKSELVDRLLSLQDSKRIVDQEMRRIAYSEVNTSNVLKEGSILMLLEWGPAIACTKPIKGEFTVIAKVSEDIMGRISPVLNPDAPGQTIQLIKVGLSDIKHIYVNEIKSLNDTLSSKIVEKYYSTVSKLIEEGSAIRKPETFIQERFEDFEDAKKRHDNLVNEIDHVMKEIHSNITKDSKEIERLLGISKQYRFISQEVEAITNRIQFLQNLVDQADLDAMTKVLQRFGFIDSSNMITQKGRTAACINAGDELVITQMIFLGKLDLDFVGVDRTNEADYACHIAAFMSCFVAETKKKEADVSPAFLNHWHELKRIANEVASVSRDCGLDLDVEKFIKSFDPSFVDLTLDWARGVSFPSLIIAHPGEEEGAIIRTMKRLDELLNQVARAIESFGSIKLSRLFTMASEKIKRGIIFLPSLYQPCIDDK